MSAPRGLSVEERRAWRDLVAGLGPAADAAPPAGLEQAACQLARARWARERINQDGMIVLDARDRPVQHPAIAVERSAQDAVRKWMVALAPKRPAAGRPQGASSAADRRGPTAAPRLTRVK